MGPSQVARGHFGEPFQKTDSRRGREAAEGDLLELLGEGRDVFRVAVPEAPHGHTREEVQELPSVYVRKTNALAVIDHQARIQGNALGTGGDVELLFFEEWFGSVVGWVMRTRGSLARVGTHADLHWRVV